MPENVLSFTTRVDLSGAKAGLDELSSTIASSMQDAAGAVTAASADIADAFDSIASSAEVSTDTINAAYQQMEAQGLETMAALNAALTENAATTTDATAASAEAVVGSVDIQAAAYKQLAAATLDNALAQQQVSGLIKNLTGLDTENANVVNILAVAQQKAASTAEQLAIAKRNLAEATAYSNATTSVEIEEEAADAASKVENATATNVLAEAEERETNVTRSSVSARMAASAELRTLEGNIQGSTRAAGAFLTMIPGVGQALQSAFVVFGAVALGEVLVDIGEKLSDFTQKAEELSTELGVSWLEGAVAQVDGLAAAVKQADSEMMDLARDADSTAKQLRASQIESIRVTHGPGAMATNKANELADQAEANDLRKDAINQQTSLNILLEEQAADQKTMAQSHAFGGPQVDLGSYHAALKAEVDLKTVNEQIKDQQLQINLLKLEAANLDQKAADVAEKKVPKIPESQFMKDSIKSPERNAEADKRIHESLERTFHELLASENADIKEQERLQKEAAELYKQEQAEKIAALENTAELQHQANSAAIETTLQTNLNEAGSSLVKDPAAELGELRTFHTQAEAEDVRFIQRELQIYAEEPNKVAQLQLQLNAARQRANLEWLQDTGRIADQVEQKVAQAYTKMESEINQFLAKTLSGQETWSKALVSLYKQVSDTFIQNVLKMAEQYIVGLAIQKTGQLSAIEADAKTAAANTYSAVSAIPVVGPALAPEAAAAAFAAVLAFGSFEHGGIVDGAHGMPVPIMAHAGERVLSSPQTQQFERMVNSSGGANHTTVNYSPSINAFDRSGFRSTLQAHKEDILQLVRQGINTGGLSR